VQRAVADLIRAGRIATSLAALTLGVGLATPVPAAEPLSVFPARIDPACRGGQARLYDECGTQMDVLAAAQAQAARTGKVVLVSLGAEWCIWCHVFEAYVTGGHSRFRYQLEGENYTLFEGFAADKAGAAALRDYVARTFVIAHIEAQYSPDGTDVLDMLDAWDAYTDSIPYIFSIRDNRFAAALPDEGQRPDMVERREGVFWYRGYDRATLLAELKKLEAAAR
jgi:thioredoxin family protein